MQIIESFPINHTLSWRQMLRMELKMELFTPSIINSHYVNMIQRYKWPDQPAGSAYMANAHIYLPSERNNLLGLTVHEGVHALDLMRVGTNAFNGMKKYAKRNERMDRSSTF